jgi:hypothetical protein
MGKRIELDQHGERELHLRANAIVRRYRGKLDRERVRAALLKTLRPMQPLREMR